MITIVYKHLPHYRVAFYDALRRWFAERGVRLNVIVGQPVGEDAVKADEGHLAWVEYAPNRELAFGRRSLVWQPVLRLVRGSDLVIVEQANKLLVNNLLFLWRLVGGPKVGYWGHGFNRNPDTALRASEVVKRWLLRRADWWFAYTATTASYLESQGVDPATITVTNNAIDVRSLSEAVSAARSADEGTQKSGYGCLFVGSLYKAKRPEFLVEVGDHVASMLGSFELHIVGEGELRPAIEQLVVSRPWLHIHGPANGPALARIAVGCELMLIPSAVGLAVLDAFALGLPLVSIAGPGHGPEIDYLQNGYNGLLLAPGSDSRAFADSVVDALTNRKLLDSLRDGAAASAATFTLDAMVEQFGSGALNAIGHTIEGPSVGIGRRPGDSGGQPLGSPR